MASSLNGFNGRIDKNDSVLRRERKRIEDLAQKLKGQRQVAGTQNPSPACALSFLSSFPTCEKNSI